MEESSTSENPVLYFPDAGFFFVLLFNFFFLGVNFATASH